MNPAELHQPDFSAMIAAAEAGQWEYVNDNLPAMTDFPETLAWADKDGLDNPDENLRDLAASVFEASSHHLSPDIADRLAMLMETDDGEFVRFRAACALCKHGEQSPKVAETLREFADHSDPEVASLAREYLETV